MDNKNNSPYVVALDNIIRYYRDYELNNTNINKNSNKISPISKSEPKYEPDKWNDNNIQYNHNCYAYLLDMISSKRSGKPQPGYFSGYPPLTDEDYNCLSFYKRLKKDIPTMYLTKFDEKCSNGFDKGFIAIDPKKEDQDYHFYVLNNTGYWSHKPGRQKATNLDANNKLIRNPLKADRKYKYFNYSQPCFFFCLNNKLARSRSRSRSKSKNYL